jgi:SPP1 family predicted phage head-tail adaptor
MPSIKPSIANPRQLSLDHVCDLISVTTTRDEIGQPIKGETSRQTFCAELSITRAEFSTAGQLGKKPSKLIITHDDEYDNESLLKFDGVKYTIYKSFRRVDGFVELFCEVRSGD